MHAYANPSDLRAHLEWAWGPSAYSASAYAAAAQVTKTAQRS